MASKNGRKQPEHLHQSGTWGLQKPLLQKRIKKRYHGLQSNYASIHNTILNSTITTSISRSRRITYEVIIVEERNNPHMIN